MRTDVNDRADGDRDDAHALHAPVCTARRTDTKEKKRRTHYSIFENEYLLQFRNFLESQSFRGALSNACAQKNLEIVRKIWQDFYKVRYIIIAFLRSVAKLRQKTSKIWHKNDTIC